MTGHGNTKLKTCNCKSEFQDKQYGKDQRVHNRTKQAMGKESKWRCTICLKET